MAQVRVAFCPQNRFNLDFPVILAFLTPNILGRLFLQTAETHTRLTLWYDRIVRNAWRM